MARPSLVMVTSSLECGGAERVLSGMANFWARKDISITFATWAGPEVSDFYELDPRVRRVWLNSPVQGASRMWKLKSAMQRVFNLRKLLIQLRPVAVLSFIHTSNVSTILAGIGLNTRIVVSERMQPALDPSLSAGWKLLRRIFYRWSDVIVAQTLAAAKWVELNCGRPASVIPNPLRSLPEIAREREPLVLAVGRLNYQKGFDLLLRAFALVAGDFPEWRLAIIGQGSEHDRLLELRNELQLAERVDFVGQVREVEAWMARAGLVVQPSRYEGFPNVILESMGMGAAVISADCAAGPSDLIEDGVNGRLVPVNDFRSLAQAMAELMSQPSLRASLGREALRVRDRYAQPQVMAQWEACLGLGEGASR